MDKESQSAQKISSNASVKWYDRYFSSPEIFEISIIFNPLRKLNTFK